MSVIKTLAVIGLVVSSASAHATLITLNAVDYAAGTDLSTISAGLSIKGIVGVVQDPSLPNAFYETGIVSLHSSSSLVPPGMFARADTMGPNWGTIGETAHCYQAALGGASLGSCNEGFNLLEFNFDTPTDFVQVVGGFSDNIGPGFVAFDAAGNVLGGCNATGFTQLTACSGYSVLGDAQFGLSLTLDTSLISRVWFGAYLPAGDIAASAISYNRNVPEPATIFLFGGALALMGMGVRRRDRFTDKQPCSADPSLRLPS